MTAGVSADWYRHFFGVEWLGLAMQQFPLEGSQARLDFIIDATELAPGATILDLCCGHGRHSVELARRGYQVIGLDLSEPSLELGRAAAALCWTRSTTPG